MGFRLPLTFALLVALAGCAQSNVHPVSPSAYEVTEKASPSKGGVAGAMQKALKAADKYCHAKHKLTKVMNITTAPEKSGNSVATVTFLCK